MFTCRDEAYLKIPKIRINITHLEILKINLLYH